MIFLGDRKIVCVEDLNFIFVDAYGAEAGMPWNL